MKKRLGNQIKKILAVAACSVFMLESTNVYASQSFNWASQKQPGSYTTYNTQRTMTYYTGNVYFNATTLATNASYVAGKCEGVDVTINNGNRYVLVSVVNRPTAFKIKPTTDGRTTMKFKMYVTHNASYSQNAYGAGTIYY